MKKFFGKIFRISYEEDYIGIWKKIYIFNKNVYGRIVVVKAHIKTN